MTDIKTLGQRMDMPMQGSKYFYYRFDLSGTEEVNLLPAAVTGALPSGIHRVRIAVMEANTSATLKVNGAPDDVADGKVLRNSGVLGVDVFIREHHELAMPITQLSAIQVGQTSCIIEVEYWSGQD